MRLVAVFALALALCAGCASARSLVPSTDFLQDSKEFFESKPMSGDKDLAGSQW
jgi:hypothetical protein